MTLLGERPIPPLLTCIRCGEEKALCSDFPRWSLICTRCGGADLSPRKVRRPRREAIQAIKRSLYVAPEDRSGRRARKKEKRERVSV